MNLLRVSPQIGDWCIEDTVESYRNSNGILTDLTGQGNTWAMIFYKFIDLLNIILHKNRH